MKNYNYNLIKLLLSKLNGAWRIGKHYSQDVEGRDCHCPEILAKIKKEDDSHIEMLREEIASHIEKGEFN